MLKNIKLSLSRSMHSGVTALIPIALGVTSLMACVMPTPAPPTPTDLVPPEPSPLLACVDFEDQTSGTTYIVPDTINTSGTTIQVLPFQWGNGTWTNTGPGASVRDDMPNETDNAMFLNNVNLGFNIKSTECLTIQYCDKGGNENLIINGIVGNDELQAFNGVDFNGVMVSVDIVDLQENCGTIRLEGQFEEFYFQEQWWITFAIGGQELYIDDICPCE